MEIKFSVCAWTLILYRTDLAWEILRRGAVGYTNMATQTVYYTPALTRSRSQQTSQSKDNTPLIPDTTTSASTGDDQEDSRMDLSMNSSEYSCLNSTQQPDLPCKQKATGPSNSQKGKKNGKKTPISDLSTIHSSSIANTTDYRPLISREQHTSTSSKNDEIDIDLFETNSSRDHEKGAPSGINISGENDHVRDLCNSFSELAADFDSKLCSSFNELTHDIDMIRNMFNRGDTSRSTVEGPPNTKNLNPNYFRDNFNSTPVAEPRLVLKTPHNTMEGRKLDVLIANSEENKTNIKLLADKLCTFEGKLDKGLGKCVERVEKCVERVKNLEKKVSTELSNLNDQIDGAFSYMDTRMDTRMDLLLGDKYREIDNHFTETFGIIDAKISEQFDLKIANLNLDSIPSIALAMDEKLSQQKGELEQLESKIMNLGLDSMPGIAGAIDEKLSQQKETIDIAFESIIDGYLDKKELNLGDTSPLITSLNGIIAKELETTRASTKRLTDDYNNLKLNFSKELEEI